MEIFDYRRGAHEPPQAILGLLTRSGNAEDDKAQRAAEREWKLITHVRTGDGAAKEAAAIAVEERSTRTVLGPDESQPRERQQGLGNGASRHTGDGRAGTPDHGAAQRGRFPAPVVCSAQCPRSRASYRHLSRTRGRARTLLILRAATRVATPKKWSRKLSGSYATANGSGLRCSSPARCPKERWSGLARSNGNRSGCSTLASRKMHTQTPYTLRCSR